MVGVQVAILTSGVEIIGSAGGLDTQVLTWVEDCQDAGEMPSSQSGAEVERVQILLGKMSGLQSHVTVMLPTANQPLGG